MGGLDGLALRHLVIKHGVARRHVQKFARRIDRQVKRIWNDRHRPPMIPGIGARDRSVSSQRVNAARASGVDPYFCDREIEDSDFREGHSTVGRLVRVLSRNQIEGGGGRRVDGELPTAARRATLFKTLAKEIGGVFGPCPITSMGAIT